MLGTIVGVPLSWVPLTAVPQRTALSHAFGGLAAGLVGIGKYYLFLHDGELTAFRTGAIVFEVALGLMTCTGSLVAAGKLQEILPTRPVTYPGQNFVNFTLIGAGVLIGILLVVNPAWTFLFPVLIVLSLAVRRDARDADRRRRHADRDLAAELVRRPGGRGDGLRAREQAADRRRCARRIVGPDPVDHHVPRDEPLVHQRAVRRVRPGRGGGGADRAAHGEVGDASRTPRRSSRTPTAW